MTATPNPGDPSGAIDPTEFTLPQFDPPPKTSWKKRLVVGTIVIVVILAALVALAPTIAGNFAPGVIAAQAGRRVKGKVKVADASFSWFGSQKVGPLTWTDEKGE